jgi:peptide/nickel transport system permease protein/oligopeptide transport system permease protein
MSESPSQWAWRRFRQNRLAFVATILLITSSVLLWLWPLLAPISPETPSDNQLCPPGARHWFGTDIHGRDLFSRVVFGARISLLVGVLGATVSLVIGVLCGGVAGYLGGRVDDLMMRTVEVLYSLPSIIFVIVLITTLEGWLKQQLGERFPLESGSLTRMLLLLFGLGAMSWLTIARIVRGQVLGLRTRAFVDAYRVLGASHARIVFRHILPHTLGIVIVYATLTVPAVLLAESFLSYLGLGIQPPTASLGSLIADGMAQINPIRVYWWLITLPAATLLVLLLLLNFVADGLRDALTPLSQKRLSIPSDRPAHRDKQ